MSQKQLERIRDFLAAMFFLNAFIVISHFSILINNWFVLEPLGAVNNLRERGGGGSQIHK